MLDRAKSRVQLLYMGLFMLIVAIPGAAVSAQQSEAANCRENAAVFGAPATNGAPAEWDRLANQATSICSDALDRSQPGDSAEFEQEAASVTATAGTESYPGFNSRVLQSIGMVDRVALFTLIFRPGVTPNQALVKQLRETYAQQRLFHHIWFNTPACSVLHDTTDLWWPGERNAFHNAVLLIESRTSLTLVSLKGNFKTNADILFLRGHFGIPNFDACAVSSLESRRPVLSP
jgi:hypothetical protein